MICAGLNNERFADVAEHGEWSDGRVSLEEGPADVFKLTFLVPNRNRAALVAAVRERLWKRHDLVVYDVLNLDAEIRFLRPDDTWKKAHPLHICNRVSPPRTARCTNPRCC